MTESLNQLMTEVFVEQPLASPGSAKHLEDIGHLTCMEDDVSIDDYPGDFLEAK